MVRMFLDIRLCSSVASYGSLALMKKAIALVKKLYVTFGVNHEEANDRRAQEKLAEAGGKQA